MPSQLELEDVQQYIKIINSLFLKIIEVAEHIGDKNMMAIASGAATMIYVPGELQKEFIEQIFPVVKKGAIYVAQATDTK